MQAALDSIVCHTPLNNLGFSRKGSALTFSVAFQALRTGLFEVGWGGTGLCDGLCRMSGWEESEAPATMDRTPRVVLRSGGRGKVELRCHTGGASGELDWKGRLGPGG